MAYAFAALAQDDAGIERRRPQSVPSEPKLPVIDPSQVPPPEPWMRRETLPVRDRWRILRSLEMLPYNRWDPYNPNLLKGDLPLADGFLKGWFINLAAISDTLLEFRRLPTPVAPQATLRPGSNGQFGSGTQSTLAQTIIVSFSLIKGDTVFMPPDYEIRVVPVLNVNRTRAEELRAVNADPGRGSIRNDGFVGMQELFFDKHLRDVSPRYDFDSFRIGVQPFTADFRGLLFTDQPFGVRLFGIRDNSQWLYNVGWFRRLEKDTNSGLNDVTQRMRKDDSYVVNLYRQDWPVVGFTSAAIALHNRNSEGDRGQFYNENGFLERPAVFGSARPRNYNVTYAGVAGEGHFGPWNLSLHGYYAFGDDKRGQVSGRPESIGAWFGAVELSRDFDWVRLRTTGVYASGDRDPFDDKAGGFDAVLENPTIAGADTSYWIRQAVPFIGGAGTTLGIRNGLLASLRSSREHGQSNFTNPGLQLLGVGADLDVAPELRLIGNANYLAFDQLSTLAALRNQRFNSREIGLDLSVGVQYRPLFIQNIVVNASFAVLLPGKALRELYGNAVDARQYSALVNVVLTF